MRVGLAMLTFLRIAVTVLSLATCVLVVALWVRSYERCDRVYGPLSRGRVVGISTTHGGAYVLWYTPYAAVSWTIESSDRSDRPDIQPSVSAMGFELYRYGDAQGFGMPFWFMFLAVACLTAGIIFKPEWRFSLRTLLIAITLVAVGLGIIAVAI